MKKALHGGTEKREKRRIRLKRTFYRVGTTALSSNFLRLPDGTVKVLVEGKSRGFIREYLRNDDFFLVKAEDIEDIDDDPTDVRKQALMRSIKESFELYLKLSKKVHVEMMGTIVAIDDPSKLADVVVTHLNVKLEDKQKIIEIYNIGERLEAIYSLMLSEIEILQVEEKNKTPRQKTDGKKPEGLLSQ